MNTKITLIFSLTILLSCHILKGQSTTAGPLGNTWAPASFLGWNLPVGLAANPLPFQTNATPRMQIFDAPGAPPFNAGFVGIGDYTFFNPQSQLHLHSLGHIDDWLQITTPISGSPPTPTDGLRIGVIENTQEAQLKQQENAPMTFHTGDGAGVIVERERFRLFYGLGGDNIGGWNNTAGVAKAFISHTGVGVNYLPPSVAMLNIGAIGSQNPSGGARPWMDVGTYYNWDSDNMYVGLKDEGATQGPNRKDAIINWGDDPTANPDIGYENLRFIFTSFQGGGTGDAYDCGTTNGLEIARMTAAGNVGIGPTFSNVTPLVPHRRLEIFDDENNHGSFYTSTPQLRLSQKLNTDPELGTWTDFQTHYNATDIVSNLYIHPSTDVAQAGTPVNGRVGINIKEPGNTLEINPLGNKFGDPVIMDNPGRSGLRLNDFRAPNSKKTSPNPWDGAPQGHLVLTVNGKGDVILVPDDDGGSSIVCSTPILNRVTKFSAVGAFPEICNTIAYDDGTHFGVNTNTGAFGAQVLYYTFQNKGGGLFSNAPQNSTLVTYNTGTVYPLMVMSETNATAPGLRGLALFSSGTYFQPNGVDVGTDEMNMYVNTTGQTFFENLGHRTFFRSRYYNGDYFGFNPESATAVVKSNFSSMGAATQTMLNTRMYIEANGAFTGVGSGAEPYQALMADQIADVNGWDEVGVRGRATASRAGLGSNFGGYFEAGGSSLGVNYGLAGKAIVPTASGGNIGGFFIAEGATSALTSNIGVRCYVKGVIATGNNYGGYFEASGAATGANYAVYAATTPGTCVNNPTFVNCTDAAGFFNGDVAITGTLYQTSDSSLKNNIQPLQSASTILSQLQPKTFYYDTTSFANMNLPGGMHYGLIAQQVETVLPNLVKRFFLLL